MQFYTYSYIYFTITIFYRKRKDFSMLNQIIFILGTDRSAYMQKITEDIRQLGILFHEKNIFVTCMAANGNHTMEVLLSMHNPAIRQISVPIPSGMLYVTDSADILNDLLDAKYYALALRHEYNRHEDFSRALYVMEEIGDIEYDSFLKAYERLAGLPWHIFDTVRLTLRETIVVDVDEFYRIYQEPIITRHTEALYRNIEEERTYVKEYIQKIYGFYGYGIWTVLLRETKEVIGRAGLSWREGFPHPEMGFLIAAHHHRKGYAEEACRGILKFAAEELRLDAVQALIHPENIPSINLCRKLGFRYDGTIPLNDISHAIYIKTLS